MSEASVPVSELHRILRSVDVDSDYSGYLHREIIDAIRMSEHIADSEKPCTPQPNTLSDAALADLLDRVGGDSPSGTDNDLMFHIRYTLRNLIIKHGIMEPSDSGISRNEAMLIGGITRLDQYLS